MEDILKYYTHKKGKTRGLVSQTSLHVKMDNATLEELEQEANASGNPKNTIINKAVDWFLRSLDDARREKCTLFDGREVSISHTAERVLDFYCKATGASPESAIQTALRLLEKDYEKHPFNHI